MEKEFIPYEQALELKELGFDEPCFAQYKKYDVGDATLDIGFSKNEIIMKFHKLSKFCSAPLYQQVFDWFREKHGLYGYPFSQMSQTNFWFKYFIQQEWKDQITSDGFITYKEAELECLKKLIEIVKEK